MPKLDLTSKLLLPLFFPIFLLDLVLYALSFVLSNPDHDPTELQSIAVGNATETHGAPRRSPKIAHNEELMTTFRGCTTVYEMVQSAVQTYGSDRIAMQHYEFQGLKKVKESDKFPTKVFGDNLVKVTYQEFGENLKNFGQGLRQLGMEPQPSNTTTTDFNEAKGKFSLVIFEDTCKEWTTALQGAMSQSMVVATCYATLGHEAVINAVNETGATALFVNWKQVQDFYNRAGEMPTLTTLIASTHELAKDDTIWSPPSNAKNKKVQVVSYDDVLEMGKQNQIEPNPPKPSDVAVIMYTSGSTGKPKGVVMKHSNLVAGLAGMATNVHLRDGQEIFVSFLPLAHVLALQIENIFLSVGTTLCYTDARQLSSVMPTFQPTIFAGVPKVWEMLQGGLEKKMEKAPTPLKVVFQVLLSWKMITMPRGIDTPVSNLFFGLISQKVFGRKQIQFGVTGGGPMSAKLQLFCRAVFNCPIIQGYALTETCVGGCFQATQDQRPGVVGPPVPCVEMILQSEPEFKDSSGFPYLHTDTKGVKGEPVIGRGEICLRGPSIAAGYYKLPDKTKEDFDKEGFFHTGDIGQFTEDGVVQIVDRKKNLVKLKGGEYVAVEAMETAFASSPYASALCVVANGELDGPLAIVCTENDALEKWAENAGIKYDTVDDLAEKDEARQEVVKSFKSAGKDAGLGKLEMRLKDVALISDTQWSPGHGMTASMKLDRKKIMDMHKEEVKQMYERNGIDTTDL